MRYLLGLAALILPLMAATQTKAVEWPTHIAPDIPPAMIRIPPATIYGCETIESVRLMADDAKKPQVPVPAQCKLFNYPFPVTWELVETYETDEGLRWWVAKMSTTVGPPAHTFILWLREAIGEPV